MSKHDADCSRRREFHPFLCTCGVSEQLANDIYSHDKREELLRSVDAAAKEQKKLILKMDANQLDRYYYNLVHGELSVSWTLTCCKSLDEAANKSE